MGLIKNRWWLPLLASCCLSHAAAGEVTMEVQAWPAARDCTPCVTLQFGVLEMRLPAAAIGKILVLPGDEGSLHLIPASADVRHSLYFMSAPIYSWAQRYHQLIPPTDARHFFDQLGAPPSPGSPWLTIRKVEQLDHAQRYIKASKGALHAYWIRGAASNNQVLHIVVDGHDRTFSVNGNLTPALYATLLANLQVTPVP